MKTLLDELETTNDGDYGALVSGLMACTGFAVWTGVSLADAARRAMAGGEFHMREAWDTGLFIYAGIPLLMFAAALAGFMMPRRAWRWPVWLVAGQIAGLLLFALPSGGLGLLPLGLVLFIAGAAFLLVPAYFGVLGAWVAGRT